MQVQQHIYNFLKSAIGEKNDWRNNRQIASYLLLNGITPKKLDSSEIRAHIEQLRKDCADKKQDGDSDIMAVIASKKGYKLTNSITEIRQYYKELSGRIESINDTLANIGAFLLKAKSKTQKNDGK